MALTVYGPPLARIAADDSLFTKSNQPAQWRNPPFPNEGSYFHMSLALLDIDNGSHVCSLVYPKHDS